ncbi:PAS-domain containing protein [Marinibacterium sp. SX1]|uniref:hybrid sensor histidine kinase/response regulator n=1 Tax=Marinibacterium sp. SX1 TaxID=3388424 RepID=UPI003D17FD63
MDFVDPSDTVERQNQKLSRIVESLIRRVEQASAPSELAYAQFERAAYLEAQMLQQTRHLERTLDQLSESKAQLGVANVAARTARAHLSEAIEAISEGFALFGPDDRLILANSRFCVNLKDVIPHIRPGLAFRRYLELVSKSAFLDLGHRRSPADWMNWRLALHDSQAANFNITLMGERYFQTSSQRTASGGTVIMHSDVTDLIRVERQERDALMDRQAMLLQATLDHLDQGVCIFGEDGQAVGRNRRLIELLHLPPQLAGARLSTDVMLDHLARTMTFPIGFDAAELGHWMHNAARQPPIAFEVKQGGHTFMKIFGRHIPSWGVVMSFTDVTAERLANNALRDLNEQLERRVEERTMALGEALRDAERATASKSRFVAAASHDLMQPLSSAKLFISSIVDSSEDETVLNVLGKAETSLAHLEQIIEALMDISKLDADKVVMDRRPIPLENVFGILRDQFAPQAAQKGLALSVMPSSLLVESDPGYLRRILENLISNAVRYTDRGRVVVGVRRRGNTARIEVWDTGRGMTGDERRVIFEEFRKLDPGSGPAQGLGLGLAIVERACASLDHPLKVSSEPGVGSCFSVSVPILDAFWGSERAMIAESPELGEPDCDGVIVLLVENDRQLRRALSMHIESWGGLVVPAESAEDAVELMNDAGIVPDALLIDYHLGEGPNGIDLYHRIARHHGPCACRIVTADRSRALRRYCSDNGLEILGKPIDRTRLLDFLNEVSAGKRLKAAG